jgi:acyl dehydratase
MTTASTDTEELKRHAERMKKKIGEQRGPTKVRIERNMLVKFAQAIGETNPIYLDEDYAKTTRHGALIAPPTYASYFLTQLAESMYDLDTPGFRSLHSDDVGEESRPIRVGDEITATARYTDVRVHEGRSRSILFQTVETTLTNQHDERVASARMVVVTFK